MPRQGLNRDAVIAAAVKLSNKRGYAELTLGNLSRALEIKPPSLYKHVAGLEDIQDALGILAAKSLTAALAPTPAMADAEKALRAACNIYRKFAREKPGLYGALQPAMTRRSSEFQIAATEMLKLILALIAALGVKKADLVHAARALRSMLHGFVELEGIGGFGMPDDIEASFRYQIDIFIRGLSR